jgi:stage III sporulation protein AC
MEIDFILKAAGIGMIVSVVCQILSKTGREEQATLVSITGIVILLLMIIGEVGEIISALRGIFGL